MLAHDPAVAAVMPAPKMAPLRLAAGDAPETVCNPLTDVWGLPRIGAPGVWAAPYHATGAGIVVGVVDTGVQWNHPALQGQYRGWNAGAGTVDHNYSWINPADLCDDSSTGTCDADYHVGPPYPDGHGTQQPTTPSMPFPRTSTRPAAARGAFTPSRRPATVL
jgi:subtilisin family serine protease